MTHSSEEPSKSLPVRSAAQQGNGFSQTEECAEPFLTLSVAQSAIGLSSEWINERSEWENIGREMKQLLVTTTMGVMLPVHR